MANYHWKTCSVKYQHSVLPNNVVTRIMSVVNPKFLKIILCSQLSERKEITMRPTRNITQCFSSHLDLTKDLIIYGPTVETEIFKYSSNGSIETTI